MTETDFAEAQRLKNQIRSVEEVISKWEEIDYPLVPNNLYFSKPLTLDDVADRESFASYRWASLQKAIKQKLLLEERLRAL